MSSENDTRARLARMLGNDTADFVLRECEVKFRAPEVDPRDVEAAKAMHERNVLAFGTPLYWSNMDSWWRSWLIAEARRERLACDAAHDEGVREMASAVVGSILDMRSSDDKLDVHVIAAHLLRAKNGG